MIFEQFYLRDTVDVLDMKMLHTVLWKLIDDRPLIYAHLQPW